MAPKGAGNRSSKIADSKAATKILTASKEKQSIEDKKKTLRKQMSMLAKEKKAKERQLKNLKKKAQKIDLTELMQMLMMKAFLLSKDAAESGSCAAASTDGPWIPKDGPEAVQRLAELTSMSSHPEVVNFAKTLRANISPFSGSDSASATSDPIEPSV
jgi:hypothetical protein